LIDDNYADPKKVKRVLLCTGKVYYDLLEKQQADKRKDVAIVRVEQLYPTPVHQILKIKAKYEKANRIYSGYRKSRRTWAHGHTFAANSITIKFKLEVISRSRAAAPLPVMPNSMPRSNCILLTRRLKHLADKAVKEKINKTTKKMANAGAD
jgi:2-oxoglutarate dehydrogenase E1 component